jgi:PAS domain S-box-containing protein
MAADRLVAVFDAAPVALLVFDRELVMVHANPAYLAAVGRTLEEIAGQRIFDVFPDDPSNPGQARALRNVMLGAIEHGHTQRLTEYPYDIPNAGGGFDRRLWNVTEVPIPGPDGRTELVVHYTEDVTEMVDQRAALTLADTIADGLREQVDDAQVALRARAAELEVVNRQLAEALDHDRSIAETLQAALLTDLPRIDDLRLQASYRPAVDQVGGDWYDVIGLPDSTTVVIGDVVGHDTRAAAAMGQLKSMLRVLTWLDGGSPADLLGRLDLALRGLGLDIVASALVATVSKDGEGSLQVTWSSAGHPAPLLIGPDGSVEPLALESDLLLGVDHQVDRRDTTTVLEPGASVLLFTDGLVERRDQSLDHGTGRLVEAVSRTHDEGVDHPHHTQVVIDRMVGEAAEDDIAVLLVSNAD